MIYSVDPKTSVKGLKRMCYNNFSAAFADFNKDYLRLAKYAVFSKIDENYYYLRFNMNNNHQIILVGEVGNAGDIGFEYEVHICFASALGYDRYYRWLEEKWKKVQQ